MVAFSLATALATGFFTARVLFKAAVLLTLIALVLFFLLTGLVTLVAVTLLTVMNFLAIYFFNFFIFLIAFLVELVGVLVMLVGNLAFGLAGALTPVLFTFGLLKAVLFTAITFYFLVTLAAAFIALATFLRTVGFVTFCG